MVLTASPAPAATDTGRASFPLHRALGASAWALFVLALGLVSAVTALSGQPIAALAATILGALLVWQLPHRLRRASRPHAIARAAADGAVDSHRALLLAELAVFGAVSVAALTNVLDAVADTRNSSILLSYLAGSAAFALLVMSTLVLLPGALFVAERPFPAARWAWGPLLLAAVALAYPGTPLLFEALGRLAASLPPAAAAAALIAITGLLSVVTTALALRLLPRPFSAVDVDPAGDYAVTARFGGSWLIDVRTGQRRAVFPEGVRAVRFSPDGTCFALDADDGEIVLRRTSDGAALRRLTGAPREVAALAFSPDGRRLAAAGAPGWVALWSLTPDAADTAERLRTDVPLIRSLAFDADGRALVVTNASATGARVLLGAPHAAPQPIHRPLSEGAIAHAVLHPTAKAITFAAGLAPSWDRIVEMQLGHGHQAPSWVHPLGETVRVAAYGPTGDHVVAASLKSDLRVFGRGGKLLDAREEVGGTVASLAVDAAARNIVIGGRWALRCWDRERGTIAFLAGTGSPTAPKRSARPLAAPPSTTSGA